MTKVKSDGGSSSYYELPLPGYLVDKLNVQYDEGKPLTMETGDVIKMLVDNDFDAGNIIKALRRVMLASKGGGKEGVDIEYDLKKIEYFTNEIRRTSGTNH